MSPADNFDLLIRGWVVQSAPTSAPAGLHQRAMLRIRARQQHLGWSAMVRAAAADTRRFGGLRFGAMMRFAALVALVLMGVILASLAAGGRQPAPPSPSPRQTFPTVTAASFLQPFTFEQPDPATLSWVLDTPDIQGFDDTEAQPPGTEYGETHSSAQSGVEIGALGRPWVHACAGDSWNDIRTAPADFLADLASAGGVTLDPIAAATVDGHPALTTAVRAGANGCTPDFHVTHGELRGTKYMVLSVPSHLTVFTVAGTTIVIRVWAQTDSELDAWMPIAAQLTSSIHFLDDASTQDFIAHLDGYGQSFTLSVPPSDAADWHAAVENFPFPGAAVKAAHYGLVACFDSNRNCANRGLAGPGEQLNLWFVTFVDSSATGGCPVWATVDALTGAFINGSAPPCS